MTGFKLKLQITADTEALPEGFGRIDVEAIARFYAGRFVRIPFKDFVAMIIDEARRRAIPFVSANIGEEI